MKQQQSPAPDAPLARRDLPICRGLSTRIEHARRCHPSREFLEREVACGDQDLAQVRGLCSVNMAHAVVACSERCGAEARP
jgi:hypothetical protein